MTQHEIVAFCFSFIAGLFFLSKEASIEFLPDFAMLILTTTLFGLLGAAIASRWWR